MAAAQRRGRSDLCCCCREGSGPCPPPAHRTACPGRSIPGRAPRSDSGRRCSPGSSGLSPTRGGCPAAELSHRQHSGSAKNANAPSEAWAVPPPPPHPSCPLNHRRLAPHLCRAPAIADLGRPGVRVGHAPAAERVEDGTPGGVERVTHGGVAIHHPHVPPGVAVVVFEVVDACGGRKKQQEQERQQKCTVLTNSGRASCPSA